LQPIVTRGRKTKTKRQVNFIASGEDWEDARFLDLPQGLFDAFLHADVSNRQALESRHKAAFADAESRVLCIGMEQCRPVPETEQCRAVGIEQCRVVGMEQYRAVQQSSAGDKVPCWEQSTVLETKYRILCWEQGMEYRAGNKVMECCPGNKVMNTGLK
jgi:hypothetical protein